MLLPDGHTLLGGQLITLLLLGSVRAHGIYWGVGACVGIAGYLRSGYLRSGDLRSGDLRSGYLRSGDLMT